MTEFPGLTRVLLFMFSYISLDSFYFKASCHNLMFHSLRCWNTREFWHQSTWNICLNKCSIRACQLRPVAFSYSSCWMYLEGRPSAGSEVNFGISLIMLWLQNLHLIMCVKKKWLFPQRWDSLLGCGTSITVRTQFALGSWRTLQRLQWNANQTETLIPKAAVKASKPLSAPWVVSYHRFFLVTRACLRQQNSFLLPTMQIWHFEGTVCI